jgi:cleavage and polyadenylation specificity factor subunit 2
LFASKTETDYIYAPIRGETATIGEHVASYSITLGESITSGWDKRWGKVGPAVDRHVVIAHAVQFDGYEVMMVAGHVALSQGSTVPMLETTARVRPDVVEVKEEEEPSGETATEHTIKVEPDLPAIAPRISQPTKMAPSSLPSSIYVGDLRLAALKAKLATLAVPVPAEFAGEGILICGQRGSGAETRGAVVAVRKVGEGDIVLEGCVGRTWFDVRKALYGSIAVVAAT